MYLHTSPALHQSGLQLAYGVGQDCPCSGYGRGQRVAASGLPHLTPELRVIKLPVEGVSPECKL